jgi:hypothetical protein
MFFSKTAQSWIPLNEYKEAKHLPKAARYFHRYLDSFKHTAMDLSVEPLPDLGTFSLVRDSQYEVERIDSNNSSESLPIAYWTRGRAALENPLQPLVLQLQCRKR